MITKLLSLDEILRHPEKLLGQPQHEIAETKIACAAVSAALAACEPTQAPVIAEPEQWIGIDEAISLLHVDRRWLFRHKESFPWIRKLSRKRLLVNKPGALAWLKTRRR